MSIAKPAVVDDSCIQASLNAFSTLPRRKCIAFFQGISVLVPERSDIEFLIQLGCFGKGSRSRSVPLELDNGEVLYLLYEEALYLSSFLKCLTVIESSSNQSLDESALWKLFIKLSRTFPVQYAVYCSLRKTNWVPKSGLKFGADFAVYLKGPSFYHARYSVIVIDMRQERDEQRARSWQNLHSLMRTSHQVVKQVMLVNVASDILDCSLVSEHEWLESVCIVRRITKRWVPETNRELSAKVTRS